jgi:hypothetical protein
MSQKNEESEIGRVNTVRYGSGKPCTILLVRPAPGGIVLKTLDSSGVTTLAALLDKEQVISLIEMLQSSIV